jgi:hypothetical protein
MESALGFGAIVSVLTFLAVWVSQRYICSRELSAYKTTVKLWASVRKRCMSYLGHATVQPGISRPAEE